MAASVPPCCRSSLSVLAPLLAHMQSPSHASPSGQCLLGLVSPSLFPFSPGPHPPTHPSCLCQPLAGQTRDSQHQALEMLSARHLPEGIIPALPPPHLGSCLGFAPQSSQCPQSGSFLSRCQAFSRQRGASEAGLGAMMQPPCHGYPGVRPPWVPGWEPLSVTQNQHSLGETLTCPCFR